MISGEKANHEQLSVAMMANTLFEPENMMLKCGAMAMIKRGKRGFSS
jgi:hypothetical protein